MRDDDKIVRPTDLPGHDTIGRCFKGCDGVFYLCDSYDPRIGFWMTPLFPDQVQSTFGKGEPAKRKNVSERAIGRTWMRIYIEPDDGHGAWAHCQYAISAELKAKLLDPAQFAAMLTALDKPLHERLIEARAMSGASAELTAEEFGVSRTRLTSWMTGAIPIPDEKVDQVTRWVDRAEYKQVDA